MEDPQDLEPEPEQNEEHAEGLAEEDIAAEDDAVQEPSVAAVDPSVEADAADVSASTADAAGTDEPAQISSDSNQQEPAAEDVDTSQAGAACDAPPEDAFTAPTAEGSQMQDLDSQEDSVEAAPAAGGHDTRPSAAGDMQQQPSASADGAAAAVEQTAGSRQPDQSYFVDGLRAIDVEVDSGPGTACKLLHVTIDITPLQQNPKPFLGGYRHKQNGVIYHHACSQTPPQPKQHKGSKGTAAATEIARRDKLTRETQTVKAATTSSQTVREASTQMARPGLEVDTSGDRVLTPRPYIPAAVVGEWRSKAALTIQRYSRGWMARRRAAALREIKAERDHFLATAASEREAATLADRMREVERRTHPLTREDFELLSRELETWRQQQTAAIKAAAEAAARNGQQDFDQQAALQLLLAKETRLLQTLDKLRVNAKHENKARKTEKVLGNLSQPKTWALSDGKKVMVHTPTTVRAAELQQLYRGLTLPNLTLDERLDVLLHVKWAVKEFDVPLTRELVELIDREADLLNRGRSTKTLDGLRRRISGQFLAFCKTPAFNPEAHKLQLVPGGLDEGESFQYVDELIGTEVMQ